VIACVVIGIMFYQKHQENSRKRFYWFIEARNSGYKGGINPILRIPYGKVIRMWCICNVLICWSDVWWLRNKCTSFFIFTCDTFM
jgi:hypothetical protein